MPTLLSKREFAALKGWSPSYITQLRKEGRLVLVEGGRVDVAATEQRLRETRDPDKDHVTRRHAAARRTKPRPPVTVAAQHEDAPGDAEHGADEAQAMGQDADEARTQVKKLRELVATEMDRIELGLLRGEITERRAVDAAWYDMGVTMRARLDALTERLAARLAAATSPAERGALLRAALHEERRSLTRTLLAALRKLRGGAA